MSQVKRNNMIILSIRTSVFTFVHAAGQIDHFERHRQHVRLTACPFRSVDQACKRKGTWQLRIVHGNFVHNHDATADNFAALPSFLGLPNAHVEAYVAGMLAVGSKRSKIYDYLLEQGQNVIKSDVDNTVRNRVVSLTSTDDNERTAVAIA
ncbi:hypothetical protein ON010_g12675 [Phytophthora cinnamomi]|nr:hypothetical protein ON010_g12675 [Phytophthora cinnamomi]